MSPLTRSVRRLPAFGTSRCTTRLICGNGPFFQCVAVSTTPDPTGTYNRYQFSYTAFNDYPKMGLWPDGYYTTYNMFPNNTFAGAKICAFDRAKMLTGAAATAVVTVTDAWLQESHPAEIYGVPVQLTPPTELIWSKALLQNRHRYDGADIAHLILRQSERIDWQRLLTHMEQYWEVLLMHLLNFRFIYPSERELVPRWLFEELLERARRQLELPIPQTRVCRGRLFSAEDYRIDVQAWGFADVVGPATVETDG